VHLIKNLWIFGLSEFVSVCMERDKKNMKLAVFGIQVAAFLIESIARGLWLVGLAKVGPSSPTAPPRSALRYEIFALTHCVNCSKRRIRSFEF
jgi:hypothetical protein